jgi:hypothetical protein
MLGRQRRCQGDRNLSPYDKVRSHNYHMHTPPAAYTTALVGLRISRPWKGYGSAIFLELGKLSEAPGIRRGSVTGEACISVEWDWRLELGSSIACGSSNSGPAIHEGLKLLRDATITSIEIEGRVPELIVRISTGHVLRSMAMVRGDPQWRIRVRKDSWLYAKAGSLIVGNGTEEAPESEIAAFSLAESAVSRWGVPSAEPQLGACTECRFYVALDGNGHLLDYGCCTSDRSPFDGHAVYFKSGCAAFNATSET